MIYLQLFLTFLKIGAVSFGGGYAMIPLIKESVVNYDWLTEEEIINFIAVSESTPGPIAVNMATFVGSSQGGILGSFLATLGVVLPSFIIILIISAFIRNLLKNSIVKSTIDGIKPAVIGLIFATAVTMLLSTLFNFSTLGSEFVVDWWGIGIFAVIVIIALVYKKVRKKNLSPIILILISEFLGLSVINT